VKYQHGSVPLYDARGISATMPRQVDLDAGPVKIKVLDGGVSQYGRAPEYKHRVETGKNSHGPHPFEG
jgi:hypothetical protein